MRIHLRADSANGTHTRFTVFIDGANCGQLCMNEAEACAFYLIVHNGVNKKLDQFIGSGRWSDEQQDATSGMAAIMGAYMAWRRKNE